MQRFFTSLFNMLHCLWCVGSVRPTCDQHQLHLMPHSWISCLTCTYVAAINKRHQIASSVFYEFQFVLLLHCSKDSLQNTVALWCISLVQTHSLTVPVMSETQYCQLSYLQVTSTNTELKYTHITALYNLYSQFHSLLKVIYWLSLVYINLSIQIRTQD